MTILLKDCRMNYAYLTSTVVDKLSGKEVYKCLLEVPATKENEEKLRKEIELCSDYAKTYKAVNLGKKGVPEPSHCPDLADMKSDDGRWFKVNISVAKPIKVYDRFGNVQNQCNVRRANSVDVQLFAYSWVHGQSWGIKLCPRAICIREDIEALIRRDEDGAGMDAGCEFTFDAPNVVNSVVPF